MLRGLMNDISRLGPSSSSLGSGNGLYHQPVAMQVEAVAVVEFGLKRFREKEGKLGREAGLPIPKTVKGRLLNILHSCSVIPIP